MFTRRLLFLVFFLALPLPAVTQIEFQFGVLERILGSEVFTQEGRKYVKGSQQTPCNFAYLEKPQVKADNGRISILATFSGKSSIDVFGRCIGFGGRFNANILAMPYVKDGKIGFKDVQVLSLGGDSLYIRRVRAALADSLEHEVSIAVEPATKKFFETPDPKSAFQIGVTSMKVTAVEVMPESLLLTMEIRLLLK